MKSLLIVALATLAGVWPDGTSYHILNKENVSSFATHTETLLSGSIVMEDAIMLRTDTGDPKEHIVIIRVYTLSGTLVLSLSGCGASSCLDSLGSLSPGNYEVRVYTDEQRMFSGIVTVGYPE